MKKFYWTAAAAILTLAAYAADAKYTPVMELNCNAGDFAQLKDVSPNQGKVTVYHQEKLGWCDGPDGKALEFTVDYPDARTPRGCIRVEQPANFDPSKGFTLIVKFKTPKDYNHHRRYLILHLAQGVDTITGFSAFVTWRTLNCRFGTDSKTTAQSDAARLPVKGDTWYDGAVVFDGREMSVYLNGELCGKPVPGAVPKVPKAAIWIGATAPGGTGYGFTGAISAIKLYQEVFTADDIANLE